MKKFLPVILGLDLNAYGTARSFHQAYEIKSLCVGKSDMQFTRHSSILERKIVSDFTEDDVFVRTLQEIYEEKKKDYEKLLLISCSDYYSALITRHKKELEPYYLFNYIDASLQKKLENKKDFYAICEQYGLDYPKTYIVTKDNYQDAKPPFGFPMAVKPNDSIEFLDLKFEGKKKAYKAHDQKELEHILHICYQAGYTGEMILQDFIPGDETKMAVLNAYVDSNGNVKMMCFAKCILEEVLPESIGNYNALLTMDNPEVYRKYEDFLTKLHYRGFANFDLKYDDRDGTYKVFEINIRQGRSSYYMTASGCNFCTFYVDDLIDGKNKETVYHAKEFLWLYVDPSVVKKYAPRSSYQLAKPYLEKKAYRDTLWYEKDRNIHRFLWYMRRRLATVRYYKRFDTK